MLTGSKNFCGQRNPGVGLGKPGQHGSRGISLSALFCEILGKTQASLKRPDVLLGLNGRQRQGRMSRESETVSPPAYKRPGRPVMCDYRARGSAALSCHMGGLRRRHPSSHLILGPKDSSVGQLRFSGGNRRVPPVWSGV